MKSLIFFNEIKNINLYNKIWEILFERKRYDVDKLIGSVSMCVPSHWPHSTIK